MLVLIEPHTGYDAGLPCDRVPQCDFWDSTGYTFHVGDEKQLGMIMNDDDNDKIY